MDPLLRSTTGPSPQRGAPRAGRALLLAALLLAALSVLAPAAWAQEGAQEGAQESAAPGWEYARLSLGRDSDGGGAFVGGWVTPETSLFVPGGPLPLAERLTGRLLNDTEDALVVLLGEIGARGWELVAVLDRNGRREFFFKRPRAGG